MKIDMSTKVQSNSPLYSFQNTSREKKANSTFKLDLAESSAETTPQNSAGDTEISALMKSINDKVTEMKEKLKNGEVEEKFQIGNTSFTIKEWERLIEKFDMAEDAIKKATAEKSQNSVENKEQTTADDQISMSQNADENTGTDIRAHIYKFHKYYKG